MTPRTPFGWVLLTGGVEGSPHPRDACRTVAEVRRTVEARGCLALTGDEQADVAELLAMLGKREALNVR